MPDHSINELSALSGLSVRTIRFYQSQGLVATVGREGPGTRYPEATLARLKLIVRMKREHLPLAEIRKRLLGLDDETILRLAAGPEPAPAPDTALEYVQALLARTGSAAAPEPPVQRARQAPGTPPAAGTFSHFMNEGPPPAATREPERSQWDRIGLSPDIELHVRRPLSPRDNKTVARIIRLARELIDEGEEG
ncbi:MAG: MerR family transcriptional regulator [Chloroflexota bacterium]